MTRKDRKRTATRKMDGGKRKKTRKLSKGAAAWNKKVMEVYHRMKKADKTTRFRDALVQAAKERKAGK
jgi:hypothetical protein